MSSHHYKRVRLFVIDWSVCQSIHPSIGLWIITSVFFYFSLEIWLNIDIGTVFEPGESEFAVKNIKKWHLVGPHGPWMSIFSVFGFNGYFSIVLLKLTFLNSSNSVHWDVRSDQWPYFNSILVYLGITVLQGPVLSMKPQKYQFLPVFEHFLPYF